MEPDPESVSEAGEETLQGELNGEKEKAIVHLEKALDAAEKEEVKYEIREALQRLLV